MASAQFPSSLECDVDGAFQGLDSRRQKLSALRCSKRSTIYVHDRVSRDHIFTEGLICNLVDYDPAPGAVKLHGESKILAIKFMLVKGSEHPVHAPMVK